MEHDMETGMIHWFMLCRTFKGRPKALIESMLGALSPKPEVIRYFTLRSGAASFWRRRGIINDFRDSGFRVDPVLLNPSLIGIIIWILIRV